MKEIYGHRIQEEPKDQPRGWWFPIGVIKLWEEGEISAEQIMLLGIINALQDPEKAGCWASNPYLGKRILKKRGYIKRSLALFQELKLIQIKRNKEDERIIQVLFQWDSWVWPYPTNGYGGDHRSNRMEWPASAGAHSPSFGLNGEEQKQGSSTSRRLCKRFHDFLHKKGFDKRTIKGEVVRIPPNGRNAIAACEDLLKQEDPELVEEVLDYYIENHGDPWLGTYYAMSKFCANFDKVKKQMFRQTGRRNGNGEHKVKIHSRCVNEGDDE